MYDPKKGKYSEQEDEYIITTLVSAAKDGRQEREVIKEISEHLNRGYAGVMSHVRKLKELYPERFPKLDSADGGSGKRINSWEKHEEELLIKTVNKTLQENKPLSVAIKILEKELNRTQGAIYQRIYNLRRKTPEKFTHLPAQRPRRSRKLSEWQVERPVIRNLDENTNLISSLQPQPKPTDTSTFPANQYRSSSELLDQESMMVLKVFEERYGRLNSAAREMLSDMIQKYGSTQVSITLLTLQEDRNFPQLVLHFLQEKLQK